MITIGVSIALVLVVLGVLAALTQIAEYPELAPMIATLNQNQAELQHMEALRTAARRFEAGPQMPMNRQEFEYYLMVAILTKDRVHQLTGLPNGVKIRKKWRRELIVKIKELALEHNMDRIV
ncbi:MAG: hypothetical protein JKX93_06610 [Rhizobiaceae bacterium]|nr:hypothetical protein [Rhizobiaceae bacterium]